MIGIACSATVKNGGHLRTVVVVVVNKQNLALDVSSKLPSVMKRSEG